MEAVTVALDGQPPPLVAFDNEVNAIAPTRDLRLDTVPASHQLVEHLEFKP